VGKQTFEIPIPSHYNSFSDVYMNQIELSFIFLVMRPKITYHSLVYTTYIKTANPAHIPHKAHKGPEFHYLQRTVLAFEASPNTKCVLRYR